MRARWQPVAIAMAALVAIDLMIPLVAQLALVHVPVKKPPAAAFAASRAVLHRDRRRAARRLAGRGERAR